MNMIRNGYVGNTGKKGHLLANSKRKLPKIRLKVFEENKEYQCKIPVYTLEIRNCFLLN